MPGPKTRYIPALDGLRAFAVLVVIAYHFGFDWAPGGLLGVTVFFVLSGYLITSLLLGEWKRSNAIDLKNFWMRRVKRLVPAIVFLLVCISVLFTLFNHDLLTKMRPDVPPALFFYSNWWYIFHDVSYFEALGSPSPLTHFWSLAIEEQFYLVWPVLLFVLFNRGAKKRTVVRITLALATISVLLMAFLYNPNVDPSRVYYGTDTRAFSLFIGALLAFIWPSNQLSEASNLNLSKPLRIVFEGIGIAAFAGLVVMVITVDGFSPFMYRGGVLLASLLTAIVIAVLIHPKSIFARGAALFPLVWIGKRSYGMYLWHFPIILLMNPSNSTSDPHVLYILLQLFIIFAASAISYRFVEDPIRKGALGRLFGGIRDGSTKLVNAVQTKLIPTIGASVLIVFALAGLIFVPPTSAVADIDAFQYPSSEVLPSSEVTVNEQTTTFDLLLVGDSVSVRTIPYFEEMFPHGAIDAAVNRPLYEGYLVYDYYKNLNLIGDVVVFSLGTNGAAVDEQIDELMKVVGNEKDVYFINTRSPQPWVQTTNDALIRASERYDCVSIIDWYSLSANHDNYFDGDGTHLTEEGAQVYVEMIRQAVHFPLPSPEDEVDTIPTLPHGESATEYAEVVRAQIVQSAEDFLGTQLSGTTEVA